MTSTITFSPDQYSTTWEHLLPRPQIQEEAAFAFVRRDASTDQHSYTVTDTWLLPREMLLSQHADYLELTDEAHVQVIQQAHRLDASVVEMHSHLGGGAPAFSKFDCAGLADTVPHMWWRLKGRPYFAIVVSRGGYDALAWLDGPGAPSGLSCLRVGSRRLLPSGRTRRVWK